MVNTDMPPKGMKTEMMIQPEARLDTLQRTVCADASQHVQ
jgi:hypothetical protein